MSPIFVASVIGLALVTVGLAQVTPSVVEAIQAKKVETNISREEALMQQIIRYRAIEGSFPADIAALVDKGYWRASDNTNGFGGTYSFVVDANKGLISITTQIADAAKRAQYINNYRHVFKPVDAGSGNVTTTFIMPSTGALAAPFPPNGPIPVSAEAPDPVINTYWYDTSGSTAKLKVSDGVAWTEVNNGMSAPAPWNIVDGTGSLPATGNDGDVRYVYDSAGGLLNTYIYYNGGWVLAGGGGGSGGGVDPDPVALIASPTSLSITGPINTTTTGSITLTNPNTFGVSLGLMSITQSGTEFTGVSNDCSSTIAANNGTCTLTVSFNPGSATTPISATLNLGFNSQTVSMTGTGAVPYTPSAGYAAKGYPNPTVGAAYSGTCATGFIPVPAMTIPTGAGTTQTIPAHCVMQYPASPSNETTGSQSIMGGTYSPTFRANDVTYQPTSRAEGFTLTSNSNYKPKSDASGKPWVYISYYEAAAACNSMGTAPNGQQIRLQRDSEWMALAHNIVGVHANWSGGTVDSGDLYRGVNSNPAPYSTSGAQAASVGAGSGSDVRTKTLTNGNIIWDLGGNVWQWTYHDFTGGGTNGLYGDIVRSQTAAPYNSQTRGMGWIPDSNAGNATYTLPYTGWSGRAPVRGGRWSNSTEAGAFRLSVYTPTYTGYSDVGFRCTHP